jgi:hypothetical protein
MNSRVGATTLLPLACLAGAAMLIASQFGTIFELNAAGDATLARVDPVDQHQYAMLVLGVFAVAALCFAVGAGSKPAAAAVAATGAVALLLFLLVDLPDAGRVGTVDDAARTFTTAEAQPAIGFWLELIGSLVLAICGAALATLTPEQLQAPVTRGGQERTIRLGARNGSSGSNSAGKEEGSSVGAAPRSPERRRDVGR